MVVVVVVAKFVRLVMRYNAVGTTLLDLRARTRPQRPTVQMCSIHCLLKLTNKKNK